jgi:plastocyanin
MLYLKSYKNFLIKESFKWIDKLSKTWDSDIEKVLISFTDEIENMVKELKEDFNDKKDPFKIHKKYFKDIESAYETFIEKILYVEEEDTLFKLMLEFKTILGLWVETFSKLKETENYNFVFKLGEEIFKSTSKYTTNKVLNDYLSEIKKEELLDDKRKAAIDFLDNYKTDILNRIKELDAENILDQANLEEQDTDDITLKPGDEVRYIKNDNEENTAMVSVNQEELNEDDNVRLVSKETGTQFEISKKDIIEVIPNISSTNQEVKDKLKKIKDDDEKLDQLNDFLDELTD